MRPLIRIIVLVFVSVLIVSLSNTASFAAQNTSGKLEMPIIKGSYADPSGKTKAEYKDSIAQELQKALNTSVDTGRAIPSFVWNILFPFFAFFTHKQVYASRHFTGASRTSQAALSVAAITGAILEVAYVIYVAKSRSIVQAIILVVCALAATELFILIQSKATMSKLTREAKLHNSFTIQWTTYSRMLDEQAVMLAYIGVLFNSVAATAFFMTLFLAGL